MISKFWNNLLVSLGLKKKTAHETIIIKEAISMDTEPTEISLGVEPKPKKAKTSKPKTMTAKKRSTKK